MSIDVPVAKVTKFGYMILQQVQPGLHHNLNFLPNYRGGFGLSPDGSQYASPERDDRGGYQIVIHSDSGNRTLTSLNGASYDAAWSPRGDLIAFVNDKPGEVEIYTVSPDGQNLRQLTSSAGFDKHPTWSDRWTIDHLLFGTEWPS